MTFASKPTAISGVLELRPTVHADLRGAFSEVYSHHDMARLGITCDFVQDNQSISVRAGTVRGLHFQKPPFAQAKLVRVLRGAIFDVAVDLRPNSATFRKWVGVMLNADTWTQLFIPAGCAHGFCTVEPDTIVLYKVDSPYSKDHEGGILWSDPELAIDWPVEEKSTVLSDKDRNLPPLKDISSSLTELMPWRRPES